MATKNYKSSNGVLFGVQYTVVVQDIADGEIVFDAGQIIFFGCLTSSRTIL